MYRGKHKHLVSYLALSCVLVRLPLVLQHKATVEFQEDQKNGNDRLGVNGVDGIEPSNIQTRGKEPPCSRPLIKFQLLVHSCVPQIRTSGDWYSKEHRKK